MPKHPALVGIIPRIDLWDIIQKEKWYHIPVESAPKDAELAEYVAFYFPAVFGKDLHCQIKYYAKVKKVSVVKRLELFPKEKTHIRADKDYWWFQLEKIEELPKPIISVERLSEIRFIPTSYKKLLSAKEINDLYNTSPLEEKMYREMKKRNIAVERQYYVKISEKEYYCLDFGIFCKNGKIDLECDGQKYHSLPGALVKDRERNNELTSYGWHILRFSGKEINKNINDCFKTIERTIKNLGGILSDS